MVQLKQSKYFTGLTISICQRPLWRPGLAQTSMDLCFNGFFWEPTLQYVNPSVLSLFLTHFYTFWFLNHCCGRWKLWRAFVAYTGNITLILSQIENLHWESRELWSSSRNSHSACNSAPERASRYRYNVVGRWMGLPVKNVKNLGCFQPQYREELQWDGLQYVVPTSDLVWLKDISLN